MPRPSEAPSPLVVFDGTCLFCNRGMQFIVERDPLQHFRFATLDSPLGQELAARVGVATEGREATMLLLEPSGHVFERSTAALLIARRLGRNAFERAIYRIASTFGSMLPRRIRDSLYKLVARNRHRLGFGSSACWIPNEELRRRLAS